MKTKCKTLCKFCTSWLHDSSECTFKGTCKFCNLPHAKGACALQSLASCASSGSKLTKLCVQDVTVISNPRSKKGDISARILFDSGSQTTLVTNKFAEQAGWSYSKAQYSLSGIGASAKTIQGKLWNISLKDNEGNVHVAKAYGVTSILEEDWVFPDIVDLADQFPNIPKDIFLA